MMKIIRCKNCDGETIPLDSVIVTVTLSKSKWCEHCCSMKTTTQDYYFCSEKCFRHYLLDHTIRWKDETIH